MSLSFYQKPVQVASWQDYNPVDHLAFNTKRGIGDLWDVSMEETLVRNPTASVIRMYERATDESLWLTPEEANQRYGVFIDGEQRLSFNEPVRENVAESLAELKRDELMREYVMRRADDVNGFAAFTTQMAAGFLGSFLDPMNLATSVIPVTRLANLGSAAFTGLKLTRAAAAMQGIATAARSSVAARIGLQAVEGALGNALVEPFVYLGAKEEQAEYTLEDSAMSLVFGAGMGATFAGLGEAFKNLSRSTKLMIARGVVADAGGERIQMAAKAVDPYLSEIFAMRESPISQGVELEGVNGRIFWEHKGDVAAAIGRLVQEQGGEVRNALLHDRLGWIDVFYGTSKKLDDAGNVVSEGNGLSRLLSGESEEGKALILKDLENLQDNFYKMPAIKIDDFSYLVSDTDSKIAVRVDWDKTENRWKATFLKKEQADVELERAASLRKGEEPTAADVASPLVSEQGVVSDGNVVVGKDGVARSSVEIAQAEKRMREKEIAAQYRQEKMKEFIEAEKKQMTQETTEDADLEVENLDKSRSESSLEKLNKDYEERRAALLSDKESDNSLFLKQEEEILKQQEVESRALKNFELCVLGVS